MAQRFAPRFNAVSLFTPGENNLSAIFRWLLDESETHGQGPLFRSRFINDLLGDDPARWHGARVTTEVTTSDGTGRIDLLMESRDGARCAVIENKPWAGWQTDQLFRYLDDQQNCRTEVRVHALVGHPDASASLNQHWSESTATPLPSTVTASGYDAVVTWLEDCAMICRAERVRGFLNDLAGYCREVILSEPSMEEANETARIILAGGEEALAAARSIAAALPLALATDAARRVAGSVEIVGGNPTVRVDISGAVIHFVLFGDLTPWAGVTDKTRVETLGGTLAWAAPERQWPRWIYVRKIGVDGRSLYDAARTGDLDAVERLLPVVARTMIGDAAVPS
ncbi:PD-(D/E)XK nuclease family protein [Sphingomonas rubra]|uniref:PDDEXK-like family protein n=1 Tax=Sphingomonas rubra TaxID=634430 RepID=UPI0015A4EF31|nr:PD-(D/E)XK nuclease family protein [Sphingomonas rubra]